MTLSVVSLRALSAAARAPLAWGGGGYIPPHGGPTVSPATAAALLRAGYIEARRRRTVWITDAGRAALKSYKEAAQ